jgi:predicted metal-binding protein
MSQIGPTGRATIYVCVTCRLASDAKDAPCPGAALADATASAAACATDPEVTVQRVRCLANCSRGPSAAIRCDNAWSYVFGGLDPLQDGPSLVTGAQLLSAATDGIMPWRGRPNCLKRGLIARMPPLDFSEVSS